MPSFEFLGPYRLGEIIGRGGMGSVYAAEHERTKQRVAVKLIASSVADEVRFRRRFAGEVEMLKRLRHKNIVRLLGYGEEEGHLFYSMELVRGESLQQRIRRLKRLDWLPAVDIAIQVCSALKHAHDIGVIHRDLKPANLLITEDNVVKLVDFGIAKLFGFGEQTVAGSVLGTADFMAPEQANSDPITPRTDLYALGSVMYAMLVGRPPFRGKNLTEVIDALKRERPVPLDLIDPGLPDDVVQLVHHLLEKVPENRPPTALAVMKRLQSMRAGLQRGQTLNEDSQQTRLADGYEGDENDESDRDGGAGLTLSGSGDESQATQSPSRTVDSDFTLRSRSDTGRGESSRREPDQPSTHFEPFGREDHDRSHLDAAEPDGHGWLQLLSIAGMIAILIGGAVLFYHAVKTPEADVLYQRIQEAAQDDDLTAARPAIRQFLDAYADDERVASLQELDRSIEQELFLRRLATKANRSGEVGTLTAAEISLIEAVDLRRRDPRAARERLRHWLAVHAASAASSDDTETNALALRQRQRELKMMTEIARQELRRLDDAEATILNDPRLQDLLDLMQTADDLAASERQAMLEGIVALYRNKPWAEPAVSQAERKLESIGSDAAVPETTPAAELVE